MEMIIETVGLLASIFAVVMFLSPVAQIHTVIKIKKSDEVSPALYMAMVVNCTLWTIYGVGINNWYIFTPNSIGAVLGIITLIVIYHYR
ncbi:MAG: SWEET family sugar transporter [Methanobacterium sp.]|jgi:solute carrier family 50 protein (sugar transporter)|nr:SWEET family sugar transporter [Methanobacterium sp.]